MKKILLMAAMSCLLTTATIAQIDPDISVDASGTACNADLEMRFTCYEFNTTSPDVGITGWIAVPSGVSYWDLAALTGLWVTPPPAITSTYQWYFGKVEVRNCNGSYSLGTGTPTMTCSTGDEDGTIVDTPVPQSSCFIYATSSCGCGSGQEIGVISGFGYPSGSLSISDL